jgi:Protein of unknown function (DUF1566)
MYLPIAINVHISRRLAIAKGLLACMLAVLGGAAVAAGPFTYSADGSEVTDTATGLVWRRCSEGQTWSGATCTGTARIYRHEGALTQAKNQAGWRLPNVKELSSLVSLDRVRPSIDITAFPYTTSNYYWTSSPYAGDAGSAWVVGFDSGFVSVSYSYRTDLFSLRLVR